MTAHPLVTRRMMLRDMGKAGFAVMILGTAACTRDPTENATPSIDPETTATSDAATSTTGSAGSSPSTAGGTGGGYEWHRVNLSFVSAYILYRGGEAVIVDTGVGGSEGDIEAALGEVGLAWGNVGALILTHLHPDHQGSVTAVVEATSDVPWFAGAGDIDGIEAPTEGQAVGDDDTVHSGLQIIETPGHTPGHISVLDPVSGVLVAGDALNGADGGVAGPSPDFSQDMGLANASVAKLAAFDYEVALFGHGEPVLEAASGRVADLAESLEGS